MIRRVMKFAVSAAIATAFAVGISALVTPASAAGCICPHIYAPVKCSNGITYTNGCYASCAHATGCVPVFNPL